MKAMFQSGAHPGGGGAVARQPPQTFKTKIYKNTDFVDITVSKVLRDFPFSQNQPLNQLMTVHWNFGNQINTIKTIRCDTVIE
jgi:hypothetical protein